MGIKRISILTVVALLLVVSPVRAETRQVYGISAVQSTVKLKRVKVGKTYLYYERGIKAKHIKRVKKWIKALPKKVQRTAKRVYLLKRKTYRKTGINIKDTLGYFIVGRKQIYLYPTGGYELKNTLYHEYGHAWDCRKKPFGDSDTKTWKALTREYAGTYDRNEHYAETFAELMENGDTLYIIQSLIRG